MSRIHRSAADGRFVTAEAAAADPERHVVQVVDTRPPDLRVQRMNEHFTKIYLAPDRVIHIFTGTYGLDQDYHDHPFGADIRVLSGGYLEHVLDRETGEVTEIERREGDAFHNAAGTVHKMFHLTAVPTITEFRSGPHEREWGLYQTRPDGIWHRLWCSDEWARVG